MVGISHKEAAGWLIPVMLAALLGVLGWMATNIAEISKTMSVAVTRVEDHERRLANLETLFLRWK